MADTEAEHTTELAEFRMPSLGSDMDEGTVLAWRFGVGDAVRKGDVLVDVDTDKSEIEVEIWHDGVIAELLVPPGTTVPVGQPLALIEAPLAEVSAPRAARPTTPPPIAAAPTPAPPPISAPPAQPPRVPADDRTTITPRTVYWPPPTTAAAPIVRPAPTMEAAATRPEGDRSERMRAAIAAVMSRSNREIPHYHLTQDVDIGGLLDWLETTNETRPVTERILPAAAYLRALGLAAAEHPELNGYWLDDGFRPAASVDVGVAIHLRSGGLVTPAISGVDTKTLEVVMAELQDLVRRARSGKLRRQEMTSATITLTNLGDQGSDAVFGVIHPPQVALVGVGRPTDRPVATDGDVVIRPVTTLSLSADHRATDGHTGSRFLATLAHRLEHPEDL